MNRTFLNGSNLPLGAEHDARAPFNDTTIYEECTDCDGSCYQHGDPCTTCRGEGVIPHDAAMALENHLEDKTDEIRKYGK